VNTAYACPPLAGRPLGAVVPTSPPVAVDVAQCRHREAGVVARAGAVDLTDAGPQAAEVQGGLRAQRPAHEVGGARLGPAARVVDERADEHVAEPVAIHVPGAARRLARVVVVARTGDLEPARPQPGQAHVVARSRPEHHVRRARVRVRAARVDRARPHDHVVEAVAVDVSRTVD